MVSILLCMAVGYFYLMKLTQEKIETEKKNTVQRGLHGVRLSKKVKPFLTKELHPAAAHSLSVEHGQFARLRGEKCFLRRTCRRRKRILMSSRLRARTLRGFFDTLKRRPPVWGGRLFHGIREWLSGGCPGSGHRWDWRRTRSRCRGGWR